MRLYGIAVSAGCILAKSYVLKPLPAFDVEERFTGTPEEAHKALHQAISAVKEELEAARLQYDSNTEHVAFLEVQQAMLSDPVFLAGIDENLSAGYSPVAAVLRAVKAQEDMLASLNDEYMAARAEDVRDIGTRIACRIYGIEYPSLKGLSRDVIVVAEDLLPSMLLEGDLEHIKGIIIKRGTRTSHVSILASGLEIPTIIGCNDALSIAADEYVFMDGEKGVVVYSMSNEELEECRKIQKDYENEQRELDIYINRDAVSSDGKRLSLYVNIADSVILDKALRYNVDGVGLFRTEFIFMGRSNLPSEDEQFAAYSYAAEKLRSKPLTIRTLDIGGDKEIKYIELPKESNPFMGYRGVRIYAHNSDIILTQLRAILRASNNGNVQVMFPMITVVQEIKAMQELLETAKKQLRSKGIAFNEQIKVGIMVEVPSAVLLLDKLAEYVDFISIGSNDLTQYTYAVDRLNEKVGYLYNFMDPAVLRLIKHSIDVAQRKGIECSLCGEMAGDPVGMAILVILGLNKFSVSPSNILRAKRNMRSLDCSVLRRSADKLLEAEDEKEVMDFLRTVLPEDYPL
jgi:phosphotransferase system enzyme I (PtsI)